MEVTISGLGKTEKGAVSDTRYLMEGVQRIAETDAIYEGKKVHKLNILQGVSPNGISSYIGDSGGKT